MLRTTGSRIGKCTGVGYWGRQMSDKDVPRKHEKDRQVKEAKKVKYSDNARFE